MLQKFFREYLILAASFFCIETFAECNFKHFEHLDELTDISFVKKIEIETVDSKKWNRNSFRIISHPSFQIPKELKKNFKGNLKVFYDFGHCEYKISLRQLGDLKDHISFSKGNLVHSLKINLNEGNISGITRFNLFIPETRGLKEELFGTSLLTALNFLAPRTSYIDVKFNGNEIQMLFQEAVSKEFLENNDRPEGPIFEGDEKYLWNEKFGEPFTLEKISLARQENKKWILKGPNYQRISLRAFSKIQEIYKDYAINDNLGITLNLSKLANFDTEQLKRWKHYEILLVAMGGYHGLRPHNRKFYWNSFLKSFEPIYYDGNLKFKNLNLSNNLSGTLNRSIYSDWIRNINFEDLYEVEEMLSEFPTKSLDKTFLYKIGLFDDDIQIIIETIIKNIKKLDSYKKRIVKENLILVNSSLSFEKLYADTFPEGKFLDALITENNELLFFECRVNEKCEKSMMKSEKLMKIISSQLDLEEHIFFNNLKESTNENLQVKFFNKNLIKVISSEGTKIYYDEKNNSLNFNQTNHKDWALIFNSLISDLSIKFIGPNISSSESVLEESRINDFGLTGCLNFYNVNFIDAHLFSKAGRCEDSINLVASFGNFDEISIEKSYFDALDMDFSKIEINNLRIKNAGNDCVDVSYGNYTFNNSFLELCGDKSISIGERSEVKMINLQMQNSTKGVSSKDFSRTFIDNLSSLNIDFDLEAFNKKQEFGGSILFINNLKADNLKTYADENSRIFVN